MIGRRNERVLVAAHFRHTPKLCICSHAARCALSQETR